MTGKQGYSGGCQCGAVRFRARELGRASICHCRMCQKAFGAFYGPLVTTRDLEWTRGKPSYFQSSNMMRRGFCEKCGTPLTYEHNEGVEVAIGALDDPSAAEPKVQLSMETRVPYVDHLAELPVRNPQEDTSWMDEIVSYQHPDHDTENWPPSTDENP